MVELVARGTGTGVRTDGAVDQELGRCATPARGDGGLTTLEREELNRLCGARTASSVLSGRSCQKPRPAVL
jgi:hypothetical protein